MEELKIINATDLNDEQISQVANLHFETGYYEYMSLKNKFNIAPLPFQKQQILKSFAKYTYALVDTNNDIIGFFIAAKKCKIEEAEQNTKRFYRDDFEVTTFFERSSFLYTQGTLDTDLVLYSIAINSLWRKKGLFKMFYNKQLELAKENFCKRIVFIVWASKPALEIYVHLGANIMGKLKWTC